MKTQGQIEAAICEGMNRFEQEYMGRGLKDIRILKSQGKRKPLLR